MFSFPVMLQDTSRDRGLGGSREEWLGPGGIRIVVTAQDVMLVALYGLLARDVLMGQAYVLPRQGDVAWQEHMIQTVFLVFGMGAALVVVTMDCLCPPEGWIEPVDPGEYEVLNQGLPVFAKPESTAEILQWLEAGDVIEIFEVTTAEIAQQKEFSEPVETPDEMEQPVMGAPGHEYDDSGDREMFRNAALIGKVTTGWVGLRSSTGEFLAQKFLQRPARQQ
ncbi:unnamed protein product [Symbiodinium sp. CCMP2456]|nr:unnamed protein product [Symbiodinium sp. CCMP2456]